MSLFNWNKKSEQCKIIEELKNIMATAQQILADATTLATDLQQAISDQKSLVTTLKNIINSQVPPDPAVQQALDAVDANLTKMDAAVKAFDPGTLAAGAPIITNTNLDAPISATVGSPFSFKIDASNGPNTFGATGLPAGLGIDANGLISGTPTAAGSFSTVVTVANSVGTVSATLAITVA